MRQTARNAILRLAPQAGLGMALLAAAWTSAWAQDAARILEAAGVKGGLVVHIGCGDGKLTAALRANDSYLVHGLEADAANVAKARERIRGLGLYGTVCVEQWTGARLPHVDNLVNLVVSEDLGRITLEEVTRALCPNGVAYLKRDGQWTKTVKPRPKEIDEWTHDLYDASNNAVAHDALVGPPRHMQWVSGPTWSRHHDHMASMSALVSSGGRVFYILDEGPTESIRLPGKWFLIARDAFNGTLLWKRPLTPWNTHLWPLKSGPSQLPRRLVALGEKVYVTLGLDAPVSALDAATGKVVRTYEGTQGTEEMLLSDGVLFLLAGSAPTKRNEYRQKFTYVWDNTGFANKTWAWDESKSRVLAVSAETGAALWQQEHSVAPMTLAADGRGVYFHNGEKVICLDRKNGAVKWASAPVSRRKVIPTGFAPTLVVYQDVVLFSGGDRSMSALDAAAGKTLWTAKHPPSGHASPEDLLVVDGLAWAGAIANGADSGLFTGRDLHTGEAKREFPPDVNTYWFHHRCYRSKATDKYILTSRTGIEFIDVRAKHWTTNHWVRGGCLYGIMPCNGLVYAPPHACACYIESKLSGFCALAAESPTRQAPRDAPDEGRLECGPAYEQAAEGAPAAQDDWPTYRHDAARSGGTKAVVPVELTPAWQAQVGGRLSSLVMGGGKVLVAAVETHTVHALDAASGKPLWSYTTGGRVDSPPTVHQGRVLFGSADGWVYCLRASDGALSWRFRAAPAEMRMTSYGQVESVWPAPGSVLAQGDAIFCVAGRSVFLDGGLRLVKLDAKTGRKLAEAALDDRDPESGKNLQAQVKGLNMPVALPDILSSDGQQLHMRSQKFDLQGVRQDIAPREPKDQEGEGAHIFSTIGFLDDSWFHRSLWMYGRTATGGYGGWFRPGRFVPSGRMLVCDEATVYGYGRKPEYLCNTSVIEHCLFAVEREIKGEAIRRVTQASGRLNTKSTKRDADTSDWKLRQSAPLEERWAPQVKWLQERLPVQARAMALAGKVLFVAGPPEVVNEKESFTSPDDAKVLAALEAQAAALDGAQGAWLWAVSAEDGKKLAEYKLDAVPVFDGLIAAGGRLYVATKAGAVVCFGKKE